MFSPLAALALLQPSPIDSCLAFVSTNLAAGNQNWFTYVQISNRRLVIQPGDMLTYDVWVDPSSPMLKASVDIEFNRGEGFRDRGATDQMGITAHGDGILTPAQGKWYSRTIPMNSVIGERTEQFILAFEGDKTGRYVAFFDNIRITHSDGTATVIYENGQPQDHTVQSANGYSKRPIVLPVSRAAVTQNSPTLISSLQERADRLARIDNARRELELAKRILESKTDPELAEHVQEAELLLKKLDAQDEVTDADVENVLHTIQHAMTHAHPYMKEYTGHLVGHAHIDLQWLWEWQEGIVVSRDTFAQALKFMDEFPGFSFSQSSSWIYATIAENYPDIFKRIQQKVKSGQWELVGGRVCEGDTNMISSESHARQFLYGQSFFRENFRKTATVAWEPDTFGHTAQMPQISKLGGCNYYYFCRGGKSKPLFWWAGLDGTRILAFDEPSTGSWYNSDVSYKQFTEMFDFEKSTGSKDMLWVYGVGNHGGGPTRESITEAIGMMNEKDMPNVKFSTASQFFKKLETYDLSRIPVIQSELNPVFEGCYTTHSEVKQLNRQSENWTSTAESVASVASMFGYQYPSSTFRRMWEDICFNHHHDTLPGSGVHSPYEKTKAMLNRVVAEGQDISMRAMEALTIKVHPNPGGVSLMVYNPLGWSRSGWIDSYVIQSGWDGGSRLDLQHAVATSPDGRKTPLYLLDSVSKRCRFFAEDIPAFGYKVFQIQNGAIDADRPKLDQGTVNFGDYRATLNDQGITQLVNVKTGQEFAAGSGLGRLEIAYEEPGGMSAWSLGAIRRTEMLHSKAFQFVDRDPNAITAQYDFEINHNGTTTPVTETIRFDNHTGQININVAVDWKVVADHQTATPMLRLVCDTNLNSPMALFDVPYGTVQRPADGHEQPGLTWIAMTEGQRGLAILNDAKYGMSAQGGKLRVSLIRSSYDPDPNPNPGPANWNFAIRPFVNGWQNSAVIQSGFELNRPMLVASVPYDAHGDLPLSWSPLKVSAPGVVAPNLKRAEKGNGYIARMYESLGTSGTGKVTFNSTLKSSDWVNFLEDRIEKTEQNANEVTVKVQPFKIFSLWFQAKP